MHWLIDEIYSNIEDSGSAVNDLWGLDYLILAENKLIYVYIYLIPREIYVGKFMKELKRLNKNQLIFVLRKLDEEDNSNEPIGEILDKCLKNIKSKSEKSIILNIDKLLNYDEYHDDNIYHHDDMIKTMERIANKFLKNNNVISYHRDRTYLSNKFRLKEQKS